MLRGNELRQHILFIAKGVFLDLGFERTSMDAIAASAGTTKRTLYAHFESKEQLFLEMIELVGDMFAEKLKKPEDYADDPIEAVVLFCGRFQKILMWAPAVRLYRRFTAEAERFPEGAARVYDELFGTVQKRIEEFLRAHFDQSEARATVIAEQLMSRMFHPRVLRALFGIAPTTEEWSDGTVVDPDFDPAPIRELLTQMISGPDKDVR